MALDSPWTLAVIWNDWMKVLYWHSSVNILNAAIPCLMVSQKYVSSVRDVFDLLPDVNVGDGRGNINRSLGEVVVVDKSLKMLKQTNKR
jgi:hypothetical protein